MSGNQRLHHLARHLAPSPHPTGAAGGGPSGEEADAAQDTTGRAANRLAAPKLDRELARRSLGSVTFKGEPLAEGLVAPMAESSLADGTEQLQANLARDGFILLREAIPQELIARARAEVFGRLVEVDEIRDDSDAPASEGVGKIVMLSRFACCPVRLANPKSITFSVTGRSTRREQHPDDASMSDFWRSVNEGPELRAQQRRVPLPPHQG